MRNSGTVDLNKHIWRNLQGRFQPMGWRTKIRLLPTCATNFYIWQDATMGPKNFALESHSVSIKKLQLNCWGAQNLSILGLHSLFALELTTFRVASSERCWTSGLCRARQARVPLSATVLLAVGQQGVHLAFSAMEIPDLQSGQHPQSCGQLDFFDPWFYDCSALFQRIQMAGQICSSLRPFANEPLGRTCSVSGRCCLWRLLATGRARVVICGVLEVLPVRIHRPKINP